MRTTSLIWTAALLSVGCTSSAGQGTLEVALSGEEAAVEGWPFTVDGETIGFADGWEVDVEHVYVALESFSISGSDGATVALEVDPIVADLSDGDLVAWRFEAVPARRWERLSFRMAAPTASSRLVGSATDAVRSMMISERSSFVLEASATHPTLSPQPFTIRLALPYAIRNHACAQADETPGIVVQSSSVSRTLLTFHLDHIFFDKQTDEAVMRLTAWAAAAGSDRHIELSDLQTQQLASLRDLDGQPLREEGALVVYDPAPGTLSSNDLRAYVLLAASSLGHLDGEGHCEYEVQN